MSDLSAASAGPWARFREKHPGTAQFRVKIDIFAERRVGDSGSSEL